MLQEFKNHIKENFPYLKGKKVLLAISGGIDSMVLFHLLKNINVDLSLAHCNFKLRGIESDLDEEFLINESQISSNQIFTKSFNTKNYARECKVSIQIAAREIRYNWFQELVTEHQFDYILTAHHADDNLETFLINLTRGSGLDGFTGIPMKNGIILRPLLPFSRDEIIAYAKANQLKWREDASNASTKYIRNKIRHQIIPILKEMNPSVLDSFSNTLQNLKESQQIITDKVNEVASKIIQKEKNIVTIDIQKTKLLSNPKAYLYQILKDYNFTEWNDVVNLLEAQPGKQIFSRTHRLLRDRNFLLLDKILPINPQKKLYLVQEKDSIVQEPIQLKLNLTKEENLNINQTIYVDQAILKYPLIVRKWKNGDYFYPKGMQGKKKLSKYFKDEKFSIFDKENAWLLCTSENEVIWLINERPDRRFIAQKNTKNRLKITTK